jgi:hypothetical protein
VREHGAVVALERGTRFTEAREHISDQARLLMQHVGHEERVVAPDTQHDVRHVVGHARELCCNVFGG